MRFGLDRMRRLMTALDSPHERFATVHVVGTNGKSSTARMIGRAPATARPAHGRLPVAAPHVLRRARRGRRAGRCRPRPSPRRCSVRPRRPRSSTARSGEGDRVTQFEALTAAAYWELARAGVEVAVVEAGLGGRYDATSVIDSRVQVLTNVGLEHTRWLGPTERHIAEEKLAVVRRGGTLVAGPLGPDSLAVAERVAAEQGAVLLRSGRDFRTVGDRPFTVETPSGVYPGIELRALGRFQRTNFAAAVTAAEAFIGGALDPEAVRAAARELVLPGRLEIVGQEPLVVRDGAHNPSGARALAESLPAVVGERPVVAVVSILEDKDAAGMLAGLLTVCDSAIFTRSSPAGSAAAGGAREPLEAGGRPARRGRPGSRRRASTARARSRARTARCSSPAPSISWRSWPAPRRPPRRIRARTRTRSGDRPSAHAGSGRRGRRGRDPALLHGRVSARKTPALGGFWGVLPKSPGRLVRCSIADLAGSPGVGIEHLGSLERMRLQSARNRDDLRPLRNRERRLEPCRQPACLLPGRDLGRARLLDVLGCAPGGSTTRC